MNGTEILQMIHLSTFRNFNMPLSILLTKRKRTNKYGHRFWLFQKYESTNLILGIMDGQKKLVLVMGKIGIG